MKSKKAPQYKKGDTVSDGCNTLIEILNTFENKAYVKVKTASSAYNSIMTFERLNVYRHGTMFVNLSSIQVLP